MFDFYKKRNKLFHKSAVEHPILHLIPFCISSHSSPSHSSPTAKPFSVHSHQPRYPRTTHFPAKSTCEAPPLPADNRLATPTTPTTRKPALCDENRYNVNHKCPSARTQEGNSHRLSSDGKTRTDCRHEQRVSLRLHVQRRIRNRFYCGVSFPLL